ncbi:hypothetical protein DPMN_035613 [Dreissena polymorpha]|uniref:C17orf113 probable zinc finger domain-containing protein n=1 Tax=Dreissena polymorpha TaxID=45954 RepID=A0A9D4MBB2_DREPO|nr:hypothetical protein DPMN_035613 [Dreissena polymorpha]
MAKRKITSFFLPTDNNNNDTNESSDLTVESQKKTKLNPSMKTVKKWEKELNIKLKLVVDEDDHVNQMFCEDCVQFMPDQTSSFVTGCTSIKKESVKYHRDSVIHQRSIDSKAAQEKEKSGAPSSLIKGLMKLDEVQIEKMEKLFRTAFYIAYNAKPFTDFKDCVNFKLTMA